MTYQLINTTTLEIVTDAIRREQFPQVGYKSRSEILRPSVGELKYVPISDPPATNPETHKLERSLTTEEYGWVSVPLTTEELDALAAQAAADAEREQAKALYLDLKNGTGTTLERLLRVEKVLAYILKDTYK